MRRVNCLPAVATFLALCISIPSSASAQYPSHCKVDWVDEQNAEHQLTKENMAVIEPAEGRAKIGPVKLDFCDRITPIEMECPQREYDIANRFRRTLESTKRGGMSPSSVQSLLGLACMFPKDPGFQEAAGYAVQQWANWFGQSREEAIESVVLRANEERWKKDVEAGCSKLQADEEASPEEKMLTYARRAVLGCTDFGHHGASEVFWYIDRTDQPPSEMDRVFYARECLSVQTIKPTNKDEWPKVGLCGPDVRALDRARLEKETASMPAPLKAHALETFADVKANFADLERVAKPKADADPDYKRLLYDAPQAAWNDWVKQYQKHKKAMDATFKFEKALFGPSVKGYKGCWGWVESGVIAYVKAGKFKTKEAFMEAMRSPIGYTLMNALGSCYAVTAPATVGGFLLSITEDSRVWRGPRTAARYAMIDTLNEIKADRTRFPVEYTWLDARQRNLIVQEAKAGERSKYDANRSYMDVAQGVVKTAKKAKEQRDTIRVNFKTESWMEDVVECHNTNKVYKIKPDGEVIYRRKCKNKGRAKKTFTPKTTLLHSWASKGVKPNGFVRMGVPAASEYGKGERWGYPIEVYTNKKKKKLINLYGFSL